MHTKSKNPILGDFSTKTKPMSLTLKPNGALITVYFKEWLAHYGPHGQTRTGKMKRDFG